jgi:hypothetical protein
MGIYLNKIHCGNGKEQKVLFGQIMKDQGEKFRLYFGIQ